MEPRIISMLYLLLCAAYLGLFEHNASWAGVMIKPLPILLLAVASGRLLQGAWRLWMITALLFSALGDLLLGIDGMTHNLFVAGLGSFLVAQLCYAQLFWRHRAADPRRRLLACAYVPVALLLAWKVVPLAGALAAPVIVYTLAIAAMVTGAAMANRPVWLLFAGAAVFAISDGTIAINKFVMPVTKANLWVMLSYYAAQWLIWRGALAPPGRTPL